MDVQNFLEQMKKIQDAALEFLDNNENVEESFHIFSNIIKDIKIYNNQHVIRLILHLISKIGNNYHHGPNFFSKIERIFKLFKNDISKFLTNSEIFNIFKECKRIILFLIKEKIIMIDDEIINEITSPQFIKYKYPQYFWPEIKSFILSDKNKKENSEKSSNLYYLYQDIFEKKDNQQKTKNNYDDNWIYEMTNNFPENFEEKRTIGENDNYICELIRKDLIKEFIVYVNKNNYPLKSRIDLSIFETNPFLLKKQLESKKFTFNSNLFSLLGSNKSMLDSEENDDYGITLIKYASFFGSIQIFNYLQQNKVPLTSSIWPFAIHGKNSEIIHFLEDNHIEPLENKYDECFIEAIKCHHNDVANYFLNNYLQDEKFYLNNSLVQFLENYNFNFLNEKLINQDSSFYFLCKYDYCYIIELLLKENDVDINKFIKDGPNEIHNIFNFNEIIKFFIFL